MPFHIVEDQDGYRIIASGGMKAPYGRIGGKSKLKKLIVDEYFPKDYEDLIYVEPFIGAGSIYFYKEPSEVEIINDLDIQPFTLLKGFKKYDGAKISKDLNGLYNKDLFNKIKASKPTSDYGRFLRTLQLTRTSFFNQMKTYDGDGDPNNPRNYIRTNFNNNAIKNRMKDTIILNEDYKKLIKEYDSPETFFYLDPPYEKSDKLYTHSSLPIKDVYNVLKNIKGRFLISYNDSTEAKKLFKNYYINYADTTYENTKTIGKRVKKEMLISNYDPFN
jgi:DNA adenine methylase